LRGAKETIKISINNLIRILYFAQNYPKSNKVPYTVKKIFLLLTLLFLLCQNSKAQTNVLNDSRIAPLLKQAAAGQPNLAISGRQDASMYVNMAVLDKYQKKLTWFTCYGNAFDSAQLTDIEYKYITDKTITPFDFYKQFCLENIAYLEDAESHFRQFGKDALKDTVYNHQVVYNAPPVKSAANTLQKVLAMENLLKKQCLQLAMFNSKSPSHVNRNDSFLLRKSLAGKMVRKGDTTTYYNTYLLGSATQIVINKRSPGKMFVYNRQEQVMDSIPLKSEKYASLLKEKEDVFLLYRGWLELQSQQILDARRMIEGWLSRKDTGLYTQTNLPEGKQQLWSSVLQLEKQQQAIEVKIGNLLLPDQEVVKNMLKDAYPDAPSEVSYLGSLGFAYTIAYTRGQKEYELTDHRGNVMATVSDKKKGIDEDQDGIIEYYNADVVNASDYYPFGSLMPGRTYHAGDKYRYGFNGKENDNEVKGEGNQQDYGMRIYDPRLGRFLSVDPLTKNYPWNSTYAFAENSPVKFIDLDGLEKFDPVAKQPTGITYLSKATIPIGGIVDEEHFIKAGNYRLHGVTSNDGKQWWLARKSTSRGYQDDYIVGADAVGLFRKYSGHLDWGAEWIDRAEFNGGGLWGAYKSTWTPQNVLAGIMIGLGGLAELGELNRYSPDQKGLTIWQGEDAARYLKSSNARAAYMETGDAEGILILGENPTVQEIVEEVIHHQQNVQYGQEYFLKNRSQLEVQAQDELLKIGKKLKWPESEMEEIRTAKKYWQNKVKKENE